MFMEIFCGGCSLFSNGILCAWLQSGKLCVVCYARAKAKFIKRNFPYEYSPGNEPGCCFIVILLKILLRTEHFKANSTVMISGKIGCFNVSLKFLQNETIFIKKTRKTLYIKRDKQPSRCACASNST
jgi:hypothetical protein